MCVPVSESHLQGGAVSLKSAQCNTDLFGLSLPSLQSCRQPFISGLQPLNAPEITRERMKSKDWREHLCLESFNSANNKACMEDQTVLPHWLI